MRPINGRILQSSSGILLWAVSIVVTGIALVSFVLSFSAQVELAMMARINPDAAWGWPLVVDGTIIVATFGTLILHGRSSWAVRNYGWFILIVFGAISIYANGIHAVGGQISNTEAFIIGAVPAVGLLTSTHLLVMMLKSPLDDIKDSEIARAAERAARAALKAAQASDVATAPLPSPARPAARLATATSDEGLVRSRVLAYRESNGDWPSGAEVGRWLGKSYKTGGRFLAKVRDQTAGDVSPELIDA